MEMFVWNMAISFQILFIILSSVIFAYLRDKSFRYYMLYNSFLLLYLLSRDDYTYFTFEYQVAELIGFRNSEVFTHILNFFIQIIFYHFYSLFALHFLDLNRLTRKYFFTVVKILRALLLFFFVFGIITYYLTNSDLYISLYTFLYLPVMLTIFVLSVIKASKYSDKHKHFFLIGVVAYVTFALTAFIGSFVPSLNIPLPMAFFYTGIVIETIFFSLGLAYKVKLINDERNRVRNLVTRHKHQQHITKLQGLLEGEEIERKRLAQELHDGIAGDLSAIKFNLNNLKTENKITEKGEVLDDILVTIDKSCQQIREISHNLSPSSIANFGLCGATEMLCKNIEQLYNIKINYTFPEEQLELPKKMEIHIYRIVQELLNNVVKHSEAKTARVEILHEEPYLLITVKDDGKGFDMRAVSTGIGLSNILSRVRFLNARLKRDSSPAGTQFMITVNLHHFSENAEAENSTKNPLKTAKKNS
ncbi:sensor histidine kinase [Kaistella daneshvariae]|uniref:histidine kinase n=2 Tax=Kaistella daneshvariae TaxID=2487074 RepID=A0ABN5T2N8_9FLAO|nr:sensor histidine kinase [Kaistella daneshvariae]